MQVEVDLPFFFSPVSSPAEKKRAQAAINQCASAIRAVYEKRGWKVPRTVVSRAGGFRVSFDLPNMFTKHAGFVFNAKCLRTLMELLIELDMIYMAGHHTPGLYECGVYYARTQVWDSVLALFQRGYGDCKTLTAMRVAEYRLSGEPANPVFRFVERERDGGLDYHILVQRADGSFEDPSRILGMGANENARFKG